jgi:hypothetical protein
MTISFFQFKTKILTLALLLIVGLRPSIAQEAIRTTLGQDIIVNQDYSWVYAKTTIDEDSLGMLHTNFNPLVTPKKKKYFVSDNHQRGLSILKDTILQREIRQVISAKWNRDQVLDCDDKIKLFKAMLADTASDPVALLVLDSTRIVIDSIKKEHKRNINAADSAIKQLSKYYQTVEKLADTNEKARNKKMIKLSENLGIDISQYTSLWYEKTLSSNYKLANDKSIIDYKPAKNCANDTLYLTALQKEKSTSYVPWFEYTPPRMKSFLKTKDLMTATCAVAKLNGNYVLRTRIVVASKDAAKTYGNILAGNFIKITLITGKVIHLKAINDANFYLENYTGHMIYEAIYAVEKDALSLLEKNPIDSVGIMWSSGFELYPVYEVDAVMNSFECHHSF